MGLRTATLANRCSGQNGHHREQSRPPGEEPVGVDNCLSGQRIIGVGYSLTAKQSFR